MLDRLKELRKERNVSQQALGEIVGFSQQSINKYENNNIEPDISTLIKLADYFDVSVDYLIGRTNVRITYSDIGIDNLDYDSISSELFKRLSNDKKELVVNLLKALI